MKAPNFDLLVKKFRLPDTQAIALMGSFARGEAGEFSDVDLIRFIPKENQHEFGIESYLIKDQLVVVSTVKLDETDTWFSQPEAATRWITGLRQAKPLWDPVSCFQSIQQRARKFVWNNHLQKQADAYASREMVGWIEEVHKGLEGLRRKDSGRLLNARFGLSWGLMNVMRVQRGVLVASDNTTYTEVTVSIGNHSTWAILSRKAFGLDSPMEIEMQVKAGLWLYVVTAEMIGDQLQPNDKGIIQQTIDRIQKEVGTIDPPFNE